MPKQSRCSKCSGELYLEVRPGIFTECDCLLEIKKRTAFKEAGILEEFWDMSWDEAVRMEKEYKDALRKVQAVSHRIKQGRPSVRRIVGITGGKDYVRLCASSLLIRDAIAVGRSVSAVALVDLVDLHFEDEGRRKVGRMLNADVLWLSIEIERNHSWNSVTLERTFHRRRQAMLTVLTTKRSLDRLRLTYPSIGPLADKRRCAEIHLGKES